MGELIKQYRLVLINKKKNEGVFKQYFYFDRTEDGMRKIYEKITDSIRIANDERFNYLYKDLEHKAYAIEEYKKTVEGDEMSSEIEYELIKKYE